MCITKGAVQHTLTDAELTEDHPLVQGRYEEEGKSPGILSAPDGCCPATSGLSLVLLLSVSLTLDQNVAKRWLPEMIFMSVSTLQGGHRCGIDCAYSSLGLDT